VDNGLFHSHFFSDDGKKSVSGQKYSRKTVVWFSDICVYVNGGVVLSNVQATQRMGIDNDCGGVFVVIFVDSDSERVGKRKDTPNPLKGAFALSLKSPLEERFDGVECSQTTFGGSQLGVKS